MASYGSSETTNFDEKKNNSKKPEQGNFLNITLLPEVSPRRLKISQKNKLIFFRQLSVILKSGIPLAQGLELLAENMTNKAFSKCILSIASQLSAGKDLSSSLADYPKVFDPITIGLIEAGETGGFLSNVLERIALLIESQSKIKSEIKGALIYPLIVLFLAVTVSLALLIFIVPTFQELFKGLGAELPGLTKSLLQLSKIVTSLNFFILTPICFFIISFLYTRFYSTKFGRLIIDKLTLKIPLFGDLILRSEMASMSDTLSTLVNSGIPIIDSLEKCIVASGNQVIKNTLARSIIMVKQGQALSYSFNTSKAIPRLFISMVSIGEETGSLPFMLDNLSNFYKREVEETVSALTKAMEPAVILVVAGIVGTIVIGLYLPMFSLLEQI